MSKRTDRPKLDPSSQPAPSTVSEISSNLETLQPSSPRQKRRVSGPTSSSPIAQVAGPSSSMAASSSMPEPESSSASMQPPVKKSRTNTPWTAAEEQRLKNMREAGNSWADIAKVRDVQACMLKHVERTPAHLRLNLACRRSQPGRKEV